MRRFWDSSARLAGQLAAPRLLVTLDFDGTLAALAQTPGAARLRPEYRTALIRLAAAPGVSVFILSGRTLGDVKALVGLPRLYYGGNHGIEVAGPGFSCRDPRAEKTREMVASAAADMLQRFPPGTGVLVEDKVFSASVHYRTLKPAYRAGFFGRMRTLTARQGGRLRWRRGHKVFELRPVSACDKGAAALRLRMELGNPFAVAVGDDLTDEDMFRALKGRGITVRVGMKRGSKAEYFLDRQTEVLRLLKFILAARKARGI
ncbi:MAG: trehalose-phosphatase [Elusimicrobia bacterium]|nr:trehalose-phosphatase [Elusimicrobiota bacterium]